MILIGFKHVGKSRVGKRLAEVLETEFIDLDHVIEVLHESKSQERRSCREIVEHLGLDYFRLLESEALATSVQFRDAIIALGGGTLESNANLNNLASHKIIHITAPKEIVYQRIMANGRPTFFDPSLSDHDAFLTLWQRRMPVYDALADFTVDNSGDLESCVQAIRQYWIAL